MIKKHRNRNDYYYAGDGLWVRDFTKKSVPATDINNLIPESDMPTLMDNESVNHTRMLQQIDTENLRHDKIAIVNNGYGYDDSLIKLLPNDVIIMGVHDVLKLWNNSRRLNYYIVNNPYEECMTYLPKHQRWARCIASIRTNHEFIKKYNGLTYVYSPVSDGVYSGLKSDADFFIDDYRNAICAAISLSYQFDVKKLLLMWSDDIYDKAREGAEKLEENLWVYPQQKKSHNLIEANLYWLKKAGVKIGHHGEGLKYKNAAYISGDDMDEFFADDK